MNERAALETPGCFIMLSPSLQQATRRCRLIHRILGLGICFVLFLFIYFFVVVVLSASRKLQHGNLLECANISLQQIIRCCLLTVNCSKVTVFRVQIFSPASNTLFAYHKFSLGNSHRFSVEEHFSL